ncbi:MAG: hypothetical protein QF707_01785, partial [Candidatus Poseidoniaceae archaeon]|nr:hypothetical protein [Candidatus Poseidoniaceae archaeon]
MSISSLASVSGIGSRRIESEITGAGADGVGSSATGTAVGRALTIARESLAESRDTSPLRSS